MLQRASPFAGMQLTGADVYWLAIRAMAGGGSDAAALADAQAFMRQIAEDNTRGGGRRGKPILTTLHLEEARLDEAHLEGAFLGDAHLEAVHFRRAHLEDADLTRAHLEGAEFGPGLLGGEGASLKGADLAEAHLEGAGLIGAHLEGASLYQAHLEGADLNGAQFDENTSLEDAILGPGARGDWLDRLRHRNRNAALGDIKWRDADLTAVPWERLRRLGDERDAGLRDDADEHRAVVRAYRQLAQRLRDQGMADDADRFAHRAQIRQRGVLLHTFRLSQYLFSWVLAILAGYGFQPLRTVFWYLVTVVGFAFAYYQLGPAAGHTFQPDGAVIFSLTSFHGRGFFPGGLDVESVVTKLAAIEAVVGLIIEISFIATFTQRFFGAK
jgi:uncharacterized protein YjbI with pentapeptide repeats